jgi:cystathionine beta-synthase
MDIKNNVIETIGNTPLIQLHETVKEISATVLAKVETFNPGHSIKDRMALKMIVDAEQKGLLKPGGTIIECTSGNTGMGIAIVAAIKGYKCIFTTSDKQSKEKIDMLKAFGAEVIVCPTNVGPEDPKSYYSVAARINKETPNSYWSNQYDNLSNRQAHYESTGPEIWSQTDGKITHLVVGVGTGGTISGTAKYLKEQNPNIQIWGIDTYGSVFKKYHETGIFDEAEIYPYITEGIGEDILPKNVDFDLIDHFEKVTDKEGALAARDLARKEGLLLGYSAGSALAGLLQLKDKLSEEDVVVIIFHDHGSRYVGKIFNDDWMRERGFIHTELKVKDLLKSKLNHQFIKVDKNIEIRHVLDVMKSKEISQLPVMEGDKMIGSITETAVLNHILEDPINNGSTTVSKIMGPAFPLVDQNSLLKDIVNQMNKDLPAVVVKTNAGEYELITNYDLVRAI